MRHGPITFLDDLSSAEARSIQRRAGSDGGSRGIVRIAPGIYVEPGGQSVEDVVRSQWAPILAHFAPGAVASGRTGYRMAPWREPGPAGPEGPGWIFATHTNGSTPKRISLPGLEIRSLPGPGPLEGDYPFLGVFMPSEARRLLDNLRPSRSRGRKGETAPSRTLGRSFVEATLDRVLREAGRERLEEILEHAGRIAPDLDAAEEVETLRDIVGALLGEDYTRLTVPEIAARRRRADPYDHTCLERLCHLGGRLRRMAPRSLPDPHVEARLRANVSFLDAYHSNCIEGTRFLVDQARRIIFEGEVPPQRRADGRDVLETYHQAFALEVGMARPATYEEFSAELKERNRRLLSGRPDIGCGAFKMIANAAGNTVFVDPDLVEGTLREGFALMGSLPDPLQRALFVHALVVLVHPFPDGNGRVSRLMMNSELVAAGQCRIVVPTISRNDYIGAMRAFSGSRGSRPEPYLRAMRRLQWITGLIADPDFDRHIELWASTCAFLEEGVGARLADPDPLAPIEWRNGMPAPASYWSALDMTCPPPVPRSL